MSQVMSATTPVAPSGAASRAGRCAAGLAAMLLVTACAAPGMKFNAKPSATPERTQMNGMDITLHRLDAQAVALPPPARFEASAFPELIEEKPKPYLIGPQDVLVVAVWDHPEITLAMGQYRTDNATGNLVEEDGTMYFPYVGKIRMAGLTISEARASLTKELALTLKNPQVDVKVLAYRSQKIYIGGEVKVPAVYTVTDVPFNLAEAINRAGGFNPTADDSHILLTRGNRTWMLDFQALITRGGLAGKIYLKDGDTLQVPNVLENPVYMMGEVLKPGSTPLIHGNLTLAKAISDAGGINGATADARSIYVIRQGQRANAVEVYHLDARNPTAMILADQFSLRPRDFVYVDAGTVIRFGKVMTQILPTFAAAVEAGLAGAEFKYFRTHP